MTQRPKPPARHTPRISIPELPSDGSYSSFADLFKTPEEIADRDARFVEAHARFLTAKGTQANALHDLVLARMRVARLMVELAELPEICRREQEHRLRMLSLENEAEATEAAIVLAEARSRLALAMGASSSAPASPSGLSIDDVETILGQLPEIGSDTLLTVMRLLKGMLQEKTP
ncbi:hypothetical protein [Hyphomicrobium sp.]|uniref:hypothetical protein n=1 Tax=Hyphomicrobium sp. TaxID=82 RepID=UPI002E32B368|nr:hypothetical protein [Hyphomicrobium sp.]HEX2841391.1 hypothetical protein [Hyphomicrobium sp.]